MLNIGMSQMILYTVGTVVIGFGLGIGIVFAQKLFGTGKRKGDS
jgi:hypothetical protein